MPELAASPGVDLDHPSVPRVYDYLLGGSAHWAIDREFAERILRRFPQFKDIAIANRMFTNRAVAYLTRCHVRQFIDLSSDVFSEANTHQVADRVAPGSRVVYVHDEPVGVAHAEVLLDEAGDPDRHAIINADLCSPDEMWEKALATGLIEPKEPVALLMFSPVLHGFRPEPDGQDIGARSVARYRELLPVGSYLGISHITNDGVPDELIPSLVELKRLCDAHCSSEVFARSRSAIRALLGEFNVIEPGMVWTPDWHPAELACTSRTAHFPAPNHAAVWAGVGQKRTRW